MAGILAAGIAPAAIGSGILMPVKTLWTPPELFTGIQISGVSDAWLPWAGVFKISNDGPYDLTVLGFSGQDPFESSVLIKPGESRIFRQ